MSMPKPIEFHAFIVNGISRAIEELESSSIGQTLYTNSENVAIDNTDYTLFLNFGVENQNFLAEILILENGTEKEIFEISHYLSLEEVLNINGGIVKLMSLEIKEFCGSGLPSYIITALNSCYNACLQKDISN